MRSSFAISAAAVLSFVGAQDIDFAGVDATPDPVINIIPGLREQVVSFDRSKAVADVISQVKAHPIKVKPESRPSAVPNANRHSRRAACDPEPSNANPYGFDLSSASNFRADTKIASVANGASTPSGYFNTFTNLLGASSAYGYLGYKVVDSYDPSACASECNSKSGCLGFNIYVERDPSLNPGPACQNPDAVANIKCSFWGGPVYTDTATNTGQWREQFEVAIAGSNGYSSLATQTADGYAQVALNNKAINSPLDCNQQGSYMGYQLFVQGAFDAKLCATACKETNNWALEHPPADGKPQLCRYFNTYILLKNGVSQGQYCSMYSQEWDASFATNDGQYRDDDHYTIQYSFGFTDQSDNGVPVCPNDLTYLQTNGQEFCSSYIGYVAPTATAFVTTTTTPPSQITTTTSTITTYTTAVTTVNAAKFNGRHARRADNGTEVTNEVVVDPYEISVVAIQTASFEDDLSFLNLDDTMVVEKRAVATPASVTAWPTSKISAACSQIATAAATTTATVTTTAAAAAAATETVTLQTVVVVQSTCTVPATNPTASSYTKIRGGNPSSGVPMVPGLSDATYSGSMDFVLALPFPIQIYDRSSTQISISIRGYIIVGGYVFQPFFDQFSIFAGTNQGLYYRVDGPIGSRKIQFSWFVGTSRSPDEQYHFSATIDEARPGVLVSRIFDIRNQQSNTAYIGVSGNGKNLRFVGPGSKDIYEGQEITFHVENQGNGNGGVSAKSFDRIDCCSKTPLLWHLCSEV